MAADILIVDDEPTIVDFMAEVLAEEGYTVHTALTLAHARAAIESWRPDLVLLDFYLAGATGDTLARDLRSSRLADIPIVMMTADKAAARELSNGGATFCLVKPFHIADLIDCVAKHIRPRSAVA